MISKNHSEQSDTSKSRNRNVIYACV